ncbi:hypothetical protein [uncultured Williamsia sp.]|uniref:hypothetical protein n=1 Tax=uncultured Williamsia sp. TaxID=259311 RepID=UPI00263157D4|nr:hypothetical protein [uncultured Williamsia sp.]
MLIIVASIAAWPYLLATFVAVQLGADNPSTMRTVVGWVFEAPWLLFLIFVGGAAVFGSSATSDDETLASTAPDNEIRRVKRG